MTPRAFAKRMRELLALSSSDPEVAHADADELLVEVLRANGYGVGCDVYGSDQFAKWYA